jgi:hypothetical protein
MKKIMVVVLVLSVGLISAANGETRWYVTNITSGETCVPIDQLGPNMKLLSHGTGSMHTPEDVVRNIETTTGLHPKPDLRWGKPPHSRSYIVIDNADMEVTGFILWDDLGLCKDLIARMNRQ